MLSKHIEDSIVGFVEYDADCYALRRAYDKSGKLSTVQVLNSKKEIYKCLFFDDNERLSNVSEYNVSTGKEIVSITYRCDGRTISSVREYNLETEKLLSVTFYKPDGKSPSSIIEYNDYGTEAQFTIFADNGECITASF